MGWIEDIPDRYSKAQMVGIGIGFMVLPIAAVALRVWAKLLSRNRITIDDYLVTAAMAVAVGCCISQLIAAFDGGLGQNQAVYPDGKPILDDPRFRIYEQCKFAINILTTVGLGLVKSSIVTFYKTIFRGRIFVLVARSLLFIIVSWSVAFFFANLFTCYPITPFIEAFYGYNCIDGLAMWYAMAISDCIVDLMIFVVPIPNVARLHIPLKQRLGIIGIFLTGASVIAFSITRTIIYFHAGSELEQHYNNETYYTSPVFFWAVIELSSAVFCACLPLYRPVWGVLRSTSAVNSMRHLLQRSKTGSKSEQSTLRDQSVLHAEKDDASDILKHSILVHREFSVEHSSQAPA